ncbi:response regulator transcription factor [Alkalihalobacillus pseudalcaliphilus]|uniref:response regulator transcription factor n=1 Tax=Alkalihalobacillus pseudalcaliphilus TaxID=79884 RepID=UPI00064D8EE0|nr:response regulator transcription factor [Alkalihalobacillus pseudalcaliphilus]KMK76810.1 transcriptional regulator [Alkalihalobacillus pseudalcaliphilus]
MKRILIIEDEPSISELQKDYLEVHGFDVEIECTGNNGLKRALTSEFDLIILDVMLPGIDGFSVCKKIREVKEVPILMVTARVDEIDFIRGLGLGADDYIFKPFNPNQLVAKIKAHLTRYARLVSLNETIKEQTIIGRLFIDHAARIIELDGIEVKFRAREFDLLAFLALHPGQVFTKEHLYERIWGMEPASDHTTVTVHIKKIRDKLSREEMEFDSIETVWGVGYRFKKEPLPVG